MKTVYIVLFEYECKHKYCLWYTDQEGKDKLIRDVNGLVAFHCLEDISVYCVKNDLIASSDPVSKNDIDHIILEIGNPSFDPNEILNFWNIVSDISNTMHIEFYGDSLEGEINKLYDKLFFASIPILADGTCEYVPKWDKEELELLTKIIFEGIGIVKDCVYHE